LLKKKNVKTNTLHTARIITTLYYPQDIGSRSIFAAAKKIVDANSGLRIAIDKLDSDTVGYFHLFALYRNSNYITSADKVFAGRTSPSQKNFTQLFTTRCCLFVFNRYPYSVVTFIL
jgi:hypothetical protein